MCVIHLIAGEHGTKQHLTGFKEEHEHFWKMKENNFEHDSRDE